jgi:hypothetical protein
MILQKNVSLRSTFLYNLFEQIIEMAYLCSSPSMPNYFVMRNSVSDFIQSNKDVKLYFRTFFSVEDWCMVQG